MPPSERVESIIGLRGPHSTLLISAETSFVRAPYLVIVPSASLYRWNILRMSQYRAGRSVLGQDVVQVGLGCPKNTRHKNHEPKSNDAFEARDIRSI